MAKEMLIILSNIPADSRWGKKSLLSINKNEIIIHLLDKDQELIIIQKAARKINNLGIEKVILLGVEWNIEYCWAFWQGYRSPKNQNKVIWPTLSNLELKELNNRLKIIDWVRNIINMSAEELSPEQLAQKSINLIQEITNNHISYQIKKIDTLLTERYAGLYAVGRSSKRQPVLLTLDYNPQENISSPILACLVGKGITFDTGGYSLKGSNFMESMKADMGGAATLVGALALAICHGLSKRIRLILCCADNMINGDAIKPGDIIHYRNGKSVEVINTDAEGRLVLADGLIDASKSHSKTIIDCATLTGAATIAVGNDYNAIFSFDDVLINLLMQSANKENEPFWRLPLAEFHRNYMPSNFADISNIATNAMNNAGASIAAAFLSHFIENYQQSWLHIDCSAIYYQKAVEQWSAGATGLGVRTIANLLLTLSKDK